MRMGSKSVKGLIAQPNSLTVPDGGVERMVNVLHSQDNLYTKERGFRPFYTDGSTLYGLFEYDDRLVVIGSNFCKVINKNTGAVLSSAAAVDAFDLTTAPTYAFDIAFRSFTTPVLSGDFAYFSTPSGVRVLRDKTSAASRRLGIEAPLIWGRTVFTNPAFLRMTYTCPSAAPATGVVVTITHPGGAAYVPSTGSTVYLMGGTTISDFDNALFGAYTITNTGGGQFTINTGSTVAPAVIGGFLFAGFASSFLANETQNNDVPLLQVGQTTSAAGDCKADRAVSYRAVIRREFANGRVLESPPSPPVFAYNIPQKYYGWTNVATVVTIAVQHNLYSAVGGTISGKIVEAYDGNTRKPELEGPRQFTIVSINQLSFTADSDPGAAVGTRTLKAAIDRYGMFEVILPPTAATGDTVDIYSANSEVDLSSNPLAIPDSDYYLAREIVLTGTDITNRRVLVDMSANVFQKGIPLYTNPSDGDTSRQPNVLPPVASYLEEWQGSLFYAVVSQFPSIDLIHTGGNMASDVTFQLQFVDAGASESFTMSRVAATVTSIGIKKRIQSLCKRINQTSSNFLAYYNNEVADTPGGITIVSRTANRNFVVFASGGTSSFEPSIGTTFGSGTVSSVDFNRNRVYWSKQNQPEAVPFFTDVGDPSSYILGVKRLLNSLIVVKEDGIFALYGRPGAGALQVRELDTTIHGVSASGIASLGNRVYAKTDHGVVAITESSVTIVSRKQIEPLVKGKDEDYTQDTVMYANEADRTLYVCTERNPSDSTRVTYAYNYLTGSWSELTQAFDAGIVIERNTPLGGTPPLNDNRFIVLANTLYRERKENTKIDWSASEDTFSASSVSGNSVSISPATNLIPVGYAVSKSNTGSQAIYRVISSTAGSFTLDRPHNISAGNVFYVFTPIRSVIRTAPLDAGDSSVEKQFTKFVINTRHDAFSYATLEFRNDWFRNSEQIVWEKEEVRRGWGTGPWGRFPWGQSANETVEYLTQPSQIVQTEVPRPIQKSTFIQAEITHEVACEGMFIQQMSFEVRGSTDKAAR